MFKRFETVKRNHAASLRTTKQNLVESPANCSHHIEHFSNNAFLKIESVRQAMKRSEKDYGAMRDHSYNIRERLILIELVQRR